MAEDRIDRFTNRPPTRVQANTLDAITVAMLGVDEMLHKLLPAGRERSLALTKLEEASMWAKKAAVFTGDEQLEAHARDVVQL